MTTVCEKYGPLIGRILISSVFLFAGSMKIMDFAGNTAFIESLGVSYPAFWLVIAIIFEILGGLSLLLGYKAGIGARALIIFTVVATGLAHMNLSDPVQMIMFTKNVAIIGGLIAFAAYGSGKFSLKA